MDDLVPVISVVEELRLSAVDGVKEKSCVITVKGEAVSGAGNVVIGLYGVLESARLPHDRQSAVVHGVELGKSAGLKAGRNKQGVRAGIDAVGSRLVVLYARAEHAAVGILVVAEGVLILPVARSQDYHLGVIVKDLRKYCVDEVETLLVCKTGNEGNDELAVVLDKSELLLKSAFVLLLLSEYVA